MAPPEPPPAHPTGEWSVRRILARHGLALLLAAGVTVAVELGLYLLARIGGVPSRSAVLATLAAGTLWVALAGCVLAASGPDVLGAVLRAGAVVDASAVTLVVLWLSAEEVSFIAAGQIYLVWAAMAMAATAATRLARSDAGRYAVAVAAACVLLAGLASPFWIGGPMQLGDQKAAQKLVAAAVYVNPFYAVCAAISDQARFVWHQSAVMYRITRIGDYAAPPAACWYASVLIHLPAAVVLAGLAALRRRIAGP